MSDHLDMASAQTAPATTRENELALQVVELARSVVIADNHALATATSMLTPRPAHLSCPLATSGTELFVDAHHLLTRFAQEGVVPTHDYAHVLMHCVTLHPFVGVTVDARLWDLAADIVAESLAAEICGERDGERGARERQAIARIEGDLGGLLTTERLYRALRDGTYNPLLAEWEELFRSDDHMLWHGDATEQGGAFGEGPATAYGDETQPDEGPTSPSKVDAPTQDARTRWEHAAKSLRVDLQTFSHVHGDRMVRLMRELEAAGQERMDYRDFLSQFAVCAERPRISDDEFDYALYTYGLDLYHDMPLVEPLEHREEHLIRDFVIVIDTSSAVSDEAVRQFVSTTFDALSSASSLFCKVNIHIVQHDTHAWSDVKLASIADLDLWQRSVKLPSFSGTDFGPAFGYVDELLAAGEFDDLAGLIYFTDGRGTYPTRVPPYPTAFVFCDEGNRPDPMPAWAIQVVLHPSDYESLSVSTPSM